MRTLAPLLLALAVPMFAQDAPKTVVATAMPVVTFDELAAMPEPVDLHAVRPHRHERRVAAYGFAPEAASGPATLTPPSVGLRFQDESEPSRLYPADAAGAVGKARVVGVNNKSVYLHDRNGGNGTWAYLSSFFGTTGTFDPRVAYDAAADRWIIAAIRDDGGSTYANSKLLIAISDTNDPQGAWHRFAIPAGPSSTMNLDYTQLALTRDNILITENLYTGDAPYGSQVYLIPKSSAYSAPATLQMTLGSEGLQYAVPVAMYDSNDASNWYLVDSGVGLLAVDAATGKALTTYSGKAGSYFCCFAPQLGTTSMMDTGGPGVHYALIRDHKLWGVEAGVQSSTAKDAVHVFRVDLNTTAVATWDIESADSWYAFPSIAVNKFGGAMVAFSAFSSTTYGSAAFTYIAPDGKWSAPSLLKSGAGAYGIERWGDFTTTVVDPVDDTTFWTTQVIAGAPAPSSTWQTWWAQIPIPAGALKHHAARH